MYLLEHYRAIIMCVYVMKEGLKMKIGTPGHCVINSPMVTLDELCMAVFSLAGTEGMSQLQGMMHLSSDNRMGCFGLFIFLECDQNKFHSQKTSWVAAQFVLLCFLLF